MANEAGNNITDGFEKLNGGTLPVGVKARLGADPLVADTDGDGLTDEFELLKMGLFTDVLKADTDGNGVFDGDEDFDADNLTNIREQSFGTNPLLDDTDGDGLLDGAEITAGSDPFRSDTDNDGLDDDSEVRLGTNITVPDSNGNGIPDGNETYTSLAGNTSLGISVLVNGTGDLGKKVRLTSINSSTFLNNNAVISPAINISLNGTMNSATVTLSYDPAKVSNPSNVAVAAYNRSTGTYDFLPSTVNPASHSVTAHLKGASQLTLMEMQKFWSIYEKYQCLNLPPLNSNETWWVGLEGYQLQSIDPWYFNNSFLFPPGYYRIQCNGAYNNEVLAPWVPWTYGAIGAWNDYDNDYGMAVRYNKNCILTNIPVKTVNIGSNTLQIEHHGGPIGMLNNDVGILSDNDGSVQYGLYLYAPFNLTDSDKDGLNDLVEQCGFPDGRGNEYHTDYLNPDTDYDGISDGEEAGEFQVFDWIRFYEVTSSPVNPDTDGDQVYDLDERELANTDTGITCDPLIPDSDSDGLKEGEELYEYGTDPADPDTDGDGYTDGEEIKTSYDPLTGETYHYNSDIRIALFLSGFIAGEFLGDAGDPTSEYFAGWMISGYVGIGDVRDIVGSLVKWDPIGLVINCAGLVVGYGDFEKTVLKGLKYLERVPYSKKIISAFLYRIMPSVDTLKKVYGDQYIDYIKGMYGDDLLHYIAKKGVSPDEFHDAMWSYFTTDKQLLPRLKETIENDPDIDQRLTWHMKQMIAQHQSGKSIQGYICNVKGAVGESKTFRMFFAKGYTNLLGVVHHVNSVGLDGLWHDLSTGIVHIVESKYVKSLSVSNLKGYIDKDHCFMLSKLYGDSGPSGVVKTAIMDPKGDKLVFDLHLHGPEAQSIANSLSSLEYIPYHCVIDDQPYIGVVKVVITVIPGG